MQAIINRLKEPSTYAGLAGLAVVAGLSTDMFNEYVAAIAGVFGFIAIFLGESKSDA